jgi:hypothetical protein
MATATPNPTSRRASTGRTLAVGAALAGAIYVGNTLLPYLEELRKKRKETEEARRLFRAIDRDESGRVTFRELADGLETLRYVTRLLSVYRPAGR